MKWTNTGEREADARRFRSVPRSFPGFLFGSWEHLVRLPFRSGRSLASAPLPTEMISPHSRVNQTHLCHQDNTLSASQRDGGFMQTRPRLVDVTSARPASATRKMVRAGETLELAPGATTASRTVGRPGTGDQDERTEQVRNHANDCADLVKEVRAALESDVSELRPQKLTRL